jgi:Zn-dependent M28 family amino/carboxypeptidase
MKDKSHPRISVLVALVVAISIAAGGQQTQTQIAPSVERLRAHIEYLASDKLEGRRTGSPGANLAAEYLAREFSRYGLRRSIGYDTPGMSILEADSPNRYLQKFPYVAGVELGRSNKMSFQVSSAAPVNLRVGEDCMPLGLSSSGQLENASVVFVGYGITASELKYDDYQNGKAAGKIAIALSGTPDGDNPHGQFAQYEDVRWKAIAARNARATALVIIARAENFRDDRLATLHYDHGAGDAGLPVVAISRSVAARLFEANGIKNFGEFVEQVSTALAQQGTKEIRGYAVSTNYSFDLLSNTKLAVSTDIIRREVPAYNVVGILDGSDPTLKNEVIVIGAHYDHLGRGGEGSLAPKEGDIHHGADDNASGTVGVLELALIFSEQRPRLKRTIVFIAFSGEEEGLLGSNYYVNHPIMPLANTVAMINMDMIGRMKNNKLIVGGVGTAQGFRDLVAGLNLEAPSLDARSNVNTNPSSQEKALPKPYVVTDADVHRDLIANAIKANDQLSGAPLLTQQGFELTLNEDGFGPSDHSSFYAKQIPVLFLWTGTHEDYHKPTDTADKINYPDEARILGFVSRIVDGLSDNDKRPVYTVAKSEATGRSMGFRVYLGTIPNYADSSDGLLLDGVRDDSPASKAGIKAGDKIVKLAGREVHNVYDYTYALGEMKAGQEYEVELLRGGERLKLKITPAARK